MTFLRDDTDSLYEAAGSSDAGSQSVYSDDPTNVSKYGSVRAEVPLSE